MFELTLQIGPNGQNLVWKTRNLISNLIWSILTNKKFYYRNSQQFQYKEGLYALETTFWCIFVVYKACSVYGTISKSKKSNGNKNDFVFKSLIPNLNSF